MEHTLAIDTVKWSPEVKVEKELAYWVWQEERRLLNLEREVRNKAVRLKDSRQPHEGDLEGGPESPGADLL